MKRIILCAIGALLLLSVISAHSTPQEAKAPEFDWSESQHPLFEATNEWKEVLPGQHIPGGLEIRMDLSSGKKMARLLQNERTTNQLQVVPQAPLEAPSHHPSHHPNPLSQEEQEAANARHKADIERQAKEGFESLESLLAWSIMQSNPETLAALAGRTDGSEPEQATKSSYDFSKLEERREQLQEYMNWMKSISKSDVERMKESIATLRTATSNQDDIDYAMRVLEDVLHSIDNSKDFEKLGGLELMARILYRGLSWLNIPHSVPFPIRRLDLSLPSQHPSGVPILQSDSSMSNSIDPNNISSPITVTSTPDSLSSEPIVLGAKMDGTPSSPVGSGSGAKNARNEPNLVPYEGLMQQEILANALWVSGTCMQSTPEVQAAAMDLDMINLILPLLANEALHDEVKNKALFALSALVRSSHTARQDFLASPTSLSPVVALLTRKDIPEVMRIDGDMWKVTRKTVNFLRDICTNDLFSESTESATRNAAHEIASHPAGVCTALPPLLSTGDIALTESVIALLDSLGMGCAAQLTRNNFLASEVALLSEKYAHELSSSETDADRAVFLREIIAAAHDITQRIHSHAQAAGYPVA